jgi:hypothetical protein
MLLGWYKKNQDGRRLKGKHMVVDDDDIDDDSSLGGKISTNK